MWEGWRGEILEVWAKPSRFLGAMWNVRQSQLQWAEHLKIRRGEQTTWCLKIVGCVWKWLVPRKTQWLMIMIPTKWLFHWEYTLFSDIPSWQPTFGTFFGATMLYLYAKSTFRVSKKTALHLPKCFSWAREQKNQKSPPKSSASDKNMRTHPWNDKTIKQSVMGVFIIQWFKGLLTHW